VYNDNGTNSQKLLSYVMLRIFKSII